MKNKWPWPSAEAGRWPCVFCKHTPRECMCFRADSKCKCPWYQPMTNLEYLEFKNETK